MAWFMDTYSMHVRQNTPGGRHRKTARTGWLARTSRSDGTRRRAFRPRSAQMKVDVKSTRVIVQGFGNVGSVTAKMFAELGARVVGISDVSGGYYNPQGIDVARAIEYAQKHRSLEGYDGGERVSNLQLLEQPCDVLVPAALEDQITLENAGRIQARLIVEGANGPTRPEADQVLESNGIVVVPDIIANAGGVIVSYFEWCQDRAGLFWKESEVNARLDDSCEATSARSRELAAARAASATAPPRTSWRSIASCARCACAASTPDTRPLARPVRGARSGAPYVFSALRSRWPTRCSGARPPDGTSACRPCSRRPRRTPAGWRAGRSPATCRGCGDRS